MGTNYYTKQKRCKSCGHKPAGIHLGKSSIGWHFSFQYNGGIYYKNVKEMKAWLAHKKIVDEYGEDILHADFWAMVKNKQKDGYKNHAQDAIKNRKSKHDFVIDGYSFTNTEFS
jgi:hypothetical protein